MSRKIFIYFIKIDNENEGTFYNNSLEKIKVIKWNDYINNKNISLTQKYF